MAQYFPRFIQRRLGRRLRKMREDAHMTLEQAAPLLDKTRSALQRIESGETRADVHLVRTMMDVYDRWDEDLLDMAREALKKGWWLHYGVKDLGFVDMETEAEAVFEFNVLNIPGLLQTDAYISAHFRDGPGRSRSEIRRQMKVRAVRKLRLTDADNPLTLTAIIDEAALTRGVGSAEVMAEQLRHLAEVSALPTVDLRVLPFGAGKHAAMAGGFILLSFPHPDEPDVLYVEYPTGALQTDKTNEVDPAKLIADRLRDQALAVPDSVELINRLAAERYGRR